MARSDQSDSDPLPFVQVHRSVKAPAALLAGVIGTTLQHSLGSLVGFWELCGDPRELERIVQAGGELAVVLPAAELEMRFFLASGHKVEAKVLAALGFAEARENGFRVRGMSRQLEAVADRLHHREAGSRGGKASVASRRRKTGTAQPGAVEKPVEKTETGETGRSEADSGSAQAPLEAVPKQHPKQARSVPEADTEAGANPEVIGKRSEVKRGSLSSPLVPDRAGLAVEDEETHWLLEAEAFVEWARSQWPTLSDPGPPVRQWAQRFFLKYQPSNPVIIRVAFARFLVWCHQSGKTVGWGLWLSEAVWEPRWQEARADAQARGAA